MVNIILLTIYNSFAGVSRSTSCVIAYLMKEKGFEFWNALNLVRSRRSIICPNMGFMRQLQEYEKTLPKKNVEETKIAKVGEYSSRSNMNDNKTGPSSPSSKQMMFGEKTIPVKDNKDSFSQINSVKTL